MRTYRREGGKPPIGPVERTQRGRDSLLLTGRADVRVKDPDTRSSLKAVELFCKGGRPPNVEPTHHEARIDLP